MSSWKYSGVIWNISRRCLKKWKFLKRPIVRADLSRLEVAIATNNMHGRVLTLIRLVDHGLWNALWGVYTKRVRVWRPREAPLSSSADASRRLHIFENVLHWKVNTLCYKKLKMTGLKVVMLGSEQLWLNYIKMMMYYVNTIRHKAKLCVTI